MDRGAWWTTGHRVAKSQTQLKLLSTHSRTSPMRQEPTGRGCTLTTTVCAEPWTAQGLVSLQEIISVK